jgi:hypothetical protein
LIGYAQTLLGLLAALIALVTGLALLPFDGWPTVTAAVAGWSLAVGAWLHHRGWPAATAYLSAWAGPTALLAPLAALGWLSPAGLTLWGPVSTVLAMALTAAYDPDLVSRPERADQTR